MTISTVTLGLLGIYGTVGSGAVRGGGLAGSGATAMSEVSQALLVESDGKSAG